MYYFENNPLDDVYTDLAKDKTRTPFDAVLKLTGKAQHDFTLAASNQYVIAGTRTRTIGQRRQGGNANGGRAFHP